MAAACSWEARDAATNTAAMSIGWYIGGPFTRTIFSQSSWPSIPFLGFYPKPLYKPQTLNSRVEGLGEDGGQQSCQGAIAADPLRAHYSHYRP